MAGGQAREGGGAVRHVRTEDAVHTRLRADGPQRPLEPQVPDLGGELLVDVGVDLLALLGVRRDAAQVEERVDLRVVDPAEVGGGAALPPDVLQVGVAARMVPEGHRLVVAAERRRDQGRLVNGAERDLGTALLGLGLEELHRLHDTGVRGRDDGELQRTAGLCLVLGGVLLALGEVVLRVAGVLEVAGLAGGERARGVGQDVQVERLVEGLPVHAVGNRKSRVPVVERRLGGIEQPVAELGVLLGLQLLERAALLGSAQRVDLLCTRVVASSELTGLECVQAGLCVRVRLEGDRVQVRELVAVLVLAPVVGVLDHGELVVDLPLLELERAGADQVAVTGGRVVELGLAHHPEAARAVEERREGRPRGDGRDVHRQVVDDRHVLDVLQDEEEQQRLAGRVLAPKCVEVVLDDGGRERRAVAELDVGTDLDRPVLVAGVARDGLGQVRDVLAVGVRCCERVVDRTCDLDAGDGELPLGEAPAAVVLGLEAVDQVTACHRLAGRASVARAAAAVGGIASAARRNDERSPHDRCGRNGPTSSLRALSQHLIPPESVPTCDCHHTSRRTIAPSEPLSTEGEPQIARGAGC